MLRKLATFMGTIIGVGVILIGGFGLMAVMNANRPRNQAPPVVSIPPSVFYTEAQSSTVTLDVFVQGEVRPRTDISLTAQVGGRIVETSPVYVDGGAFKKGDMLVKIDDTDYRLALTRANARVAQALQALKQEQAESALALRDWQELGNSTTPSDLTLRKPQLAQAQANYDAAKADTDEAKLNLARTIVRAPFDGRVRTRNVGIGQFVGAGANLGAIFSTDVAEINLALTDRNLSVLGLPLAFTETSQNPGPKVRLSATIGASTHEWAGRIARTQGAIDPATRQIGAVVVVDDPYGDGSDNGVPLAIGLFVEARIIGKPIDGIIALPLSALYGRDKVYVVNGEDKLERRIVSVAATTPSLAYVSSGLSVGDKVVTSPLRGSDHGDLVTPVANEGRNGKDTTKTSQNNTIDASVTDDRQGR